MAGIGVAHAVATAIEAGCTIAPGSDHRGNCLVVGDKEIHTVAGIDGISLLKQS